MENVIIENKGIYLTMKAKDGYKLHDINRDEIVVDEYGNETGEMIKGYTKGIVTVFPDYDFEENPRQLYAEKESETVSAEENGKYGYGQ